MFNKIIGANFGLFCHQAQCSGSRDRKIFAFEAYTWSSLLPNKKHISIHGKRNILRQHYNILRLVLYDDMSSTLYCDKF